MNGPIATVLTASGPCWVQARLAAPDGEVIFEGTLQGGQSWAGTGPIWLRLGNPTEVEIAIDGQAVSPPVAAGLPFEMLVR
ncbi:MAG: DUF4115 domain-containing protein [Acidimicrobiales bacterium]|nr:DUF4115 domain-containing protein [Acidimicrobiales bacterium]